MASFVASNRFPLVYFNIAKAGCTSTKNWLYQLDYGATLENPERIHQIARKTLLHHDFAREQVEAKFRTSLVFTFVRHPLRRAYSAFNQKIYGEAGLGLFRVPRRAVERLYGAELSRPRTLARHRADFLAFLLFARDSRDGTNDYDIDRHWAPQSMHIAMGAAVRPFDFIGRLERIDEDMAYICDRVGLPRQSLPRLNEGPPAPYSYEEVVNDTIRELGRDLYSDDLKNFAYTI